MVTFFAGVRRRLGVRVCVHSLGVHGRTAAHANVLCRVHADYMRVCVCVPCRNR